MLNRRHLLGAAALALVLSAAAGHAVADDAWKSEVPKIRVGILGGENEADRLTNYTCFNDKLEAEFGVPVELYPAADYAGVMQGLIADQLEVAGLGASGYAGIYLQDPEAVEPLVTVKQVDGSTGYHSVMLVRADSPWKTLDELEGQSLAFADPNSTSGYLVPSFELKDKGYDPKSFFGRTGFAGGHEQGIVALLNKQYDAAVTWTSGVGEVAEGYSNGNLRKMVDKGALDMKDVRIVWTSELIPNGPEVVRKDLPQEFKDRYKQFLLDLPVKDYACFKATQGGEGEGFVPVDHSFYDIIVRMREEAASSRRG
ncbi:phosphonate ABC transporter substrate-binding protein [Marinimicrococcus flavescens]|uniref:Phosphonate ABC transporter substrate-binding protein n=1 Tax=Marinimicrococcus flavescens TaxID=3031815 RepID=A0AAP3V0Q1_9PROT|nr:phosphonate ABC transporter substrate-binding protein [Marinimicrococcus flavescens]